MNGTASKNTSKKNKSPLTSLFKAAANKLGYNARLCAAALFYRAGKEIFDRANDRIAALNSKDFDKDVPNCAIVFGATVLSGVLAKRTAEMVAAGKLKGDIYFVGGRAPTLKTLGWYFTPKAARAGISAPQKGDTEASYMRRVFHETLIGLVGEEQARALCTIHKEKTRSFNTQQNIAVLYPEIKKETKRIALIASAYAAPRVMGTVLKFFRDRECHSEKKNIPLMAFRTIPVWFNEFGIGKDNWMKSPIARTIVYDECDKFGRKNDPLWKTHPDNKGRYVDEKTFAQAYNPHKETSRYLRAAARYAL